jgi:5-methylcytosine-specific restriction endonuclease McrA
MKTCSKCGETKPFSDFDKFVHSKDGRRPACKICTKEYQAKYRKQNAEKKRASQSWRLKSRDVEKTWREKNREKTKIDRHNRRATLKARGKLTPGLTEKLYKLQFGRCACCKRPLGKNYHMDHIVPLALGGANTDDNIQLLHQKCNHQKGSKHPVDFMRQLGYLL